MRPQTSRAISTKDAALPTALPRSAHCPLFGAGEAALRAQRKAAPAGQVLSPPRRSAASNSSLFSKRARFCLVTSPSTTTLCPHGMKRSGSKPPARSLAGLLQPIRLLTRSAEEQRQSALELDLFQAGYEVEVPVGAPVLAIGDGSQPGLLLAADKTSLSCLAIEAIGFTKIVVKANAEPLGAFPASTKRSRGCANCKRSKTLASNGALPKKHHGSSIHLSARGRSRVLADATRACERVHGT